MFKWILLFASFFFALVSQATAQQPGTEKIMLSPSMVVNESGHGDASLLVDEQALAGDPLTGNGSSPETYWFPGWQADLYPASAYIDLGQEHVLSDIFLYDYTGIKDFTVEVGGPGNWVHLFTDPMSSYNTWNRHNVDVTTRYVRVSRSSAGGNMNEIVLYGTPVSNAPPVFDSVPAQVVQAGGQLTVAISASDSDGDPLIFSLVSSPAFVALTDSGNGTASLQVAPQVGDVGVYNIQVSVSDGNGGMDSTAFVLTVTNASAGGVAKILLFPSMVVNESGHGDASLLVDEQALSGDPLDGNSGNPQTYWFPGWQSDIYPASAYIDLGREHVLSNIFLYDFTGKADFTLEIGEPGNWTHLLTDGMESYNSWNKHDVVATTRYVRVTRSTAGGNMSEIVFYGRPVENNQGEVPDHLEYQALVDLYNCTDGPNWHEYVKENWLIGETSADFSTWGGVLVENGDVTGLLLGHFGLNGHLCPSIGNLKKLKTLDLAWNTVGGNFPQEFSGLESLEVVNLEGVEAGYGHNILEKLYSVPSIKEITLYWSNSLSILTPEIGNLVNLESFRVWHTNLKGPIPEEIGNCKKLRFLDLNTNMIEGVIPSSIGQLKDLEYLDLRFNDFSGVVPSSISNLSKLNSLDLSINQLSGEVLKYLTGIPQIKVIGLNDNQFSEKLPSDINSFNNLHHFDISNNDFSGDIHGNIFAPVIEFSHGDWSAFGNRFSIANNNISAVPDISYIEFFDDYMEHTFSCDLSNNNLSFEYLEPYFGHPEGHKFMNFVYSPQSLPPPETIEVSHSSDVTLESGDHAPHNRYQWQKEVSGTWADIASATGASYTVPSVTEAGKYRCKVTNDWVTDMILYSQTIHIEVEEQLVPTPPVDMVRNRPVD